MGSLIVIPARWGSTRFPGKPLAMLRGKTVLQRVVAAARYAVRDRADVEIVVGTDDPRIERHAREMDCAVVMTDVAITNGTMRALAVAQRWPAPIAAIVNLQGDTPFVSPIMLGHILDAVHGGAPVATVAVPLSWKDLDDLRNQKCSTPFSGTTCVLDATGRALWFSKQILPAIRDEAALRRTEAMSPVLRHIGFYGYTLDALRRFAERPQTWLETLEGLEQLRFLELGIPISVTVVDPPTLACSGIDTPQDLDRAERLLAEHGEPEWS